MLGSDFVLFKTHGGKSSFMNLIDLLLLFAVLTLSYAWSVLSPLCSWMAMPCVEWVVPAPVGVSSFKSKLSQQKWITILFMLSISVGNTLSDIIIFSAILVSSCSTEEYDIQCPNLFSNVTSCALPVRRWLDISRSKCLGKNHTPLLMV